MGAYLDYMGEINAITRVFECGRDCSMRKNHQPMLALKMDGDHIQGMWAAFRIWKKAKKLVCPLETPGGNATLVTPDF